MVGEVVVLFCVKFFYRHTCIIRPYTLIVERFNDEHVTFHGTLKGNTNKKELSQLAKGNLFDCDVTGGYLAILSQNEVYFFGYLGSQKFILFS
jgi:hypothetical protein